MFSLSKLFKWSRDSPDDRERLVTSEKEKFAPIAKPHLVTKLIGEFTLLKNMTHDQFFDASVPISQEKLSSNTLKFVAKDGGEIHVELGDSGIPDIAHHRLVLEEWIYEGDHGAWVSNEVVSRVDLTYLSIIIDHLHVDRKIMVMMAFYQEDRFWCNVRHFNQDDKGTYYYYQKEKTLEPLPVDFWIQREGLRQAIHLAKTRFVGTWTSHTVIQEPTIELKHSGFPEPSTRLVATLEHFEIKIEGKALKFAHEDHEKVLVWNPQSIEMMALMEQEFVIIHVDRAAQSMFLEERLAIEDGELHWTRRWKDGLTQRKCYSRVQ